MPLKQTSVDFYSRLTIVKPVRQAVSSSRVPETLMKTKKRSHPTCPPAHPQPNTRERVWAGEQRRRAGRRRASRAAPSAGPSRGLDTPTPDLSESLSESATADPPQTRNLYPEPPPPTPANPPAGAEAQPTSPRLRPPSPLSPSRPYRGSRRRRSSPTHAFRPSRAKAAEGQGGQCRASDGRGWVPDETAVRRGEGGGSCRRDWTPRGEEAVKAVGRGGGGRAEETAL